MSTCSGDSALWRPAVGVVFDVVAMCVRSFVVVVCCSLCVVRVKVKQVYRENWSVKKGGESKDGLAQVVVKCRRL